MTCTLTLKVIVVTAKPWIYTKPILLKIQPRSYTETTHTCLHTYIQRFDLKGSTLGQVALHTYTHTDICIHTYMHTHVHTYIHANKHIVLGPHRLHTWPRSYTETAHTHIHIHIHIFIHIHTHTCMHTCIQKRVYLKGSTLGRVATPEYIHTYIHTYTHTHIRTHTYIHTYNTYIQYIHTYIYTYIQLDRDITFLQERNLMDYSLYVGVPKRHLSNKGTVPKESCCDVFITSA
jgi:hypothetical protein